MALYHEITPETAFSLLEENTLCVDMRSKEDYAKGHIPNAVHLMEPAQIIRQKGVNLDDPVVVYCNRGISCKKFAENLVQNHGFKEVYIIEGGFKSWLNQYPEHVDLD